MVTNMETLPPIIQVGDVLISSEILTEKFCCDLSVCKGQCCVEGDAGAPVTLEEIAAIEECVDEVWPDLSASAQSVIDRQGVAYTDQEGDLVTSIVRGRDCVFTYYGECCGVPNCCLCALEKAYREGRTGFCKPISCALYPIREKRLGTGLVGLNYNRWAVCKMAVAKGIEANLRLYEFLREPLTRRFGQAWYQELLDVVAELKRQGMLPL
jgi:hypothetical protein